MFNPIFWCGCMKVLYNYITWRPAFRNAITCHLNEVIWASLWENRSLEFPTRSDTNPTFSHRSWLETWHLRFRKKRDRTIRLAKTKALISLAVTAKLICVFIYGYAKKPVFSYRGSYHKRAKQIYSFPFFSSPEPKAQRWAYSIPVDPASVRPCVRPCVRASVNIFKLEYLRNQWANRNQILSEASLGWGIDCIRFWTR